MMINTLMFVSRPAGCPNKKGSAPKGETALAGAAGW